MKNYDCEMLYHPRKDNVVVDALSRKEVMAPIVDISLRMTVITLLLEQIREAQVETMNEEHRKSEHIVVHVASFDYDSHGSLSLHQRVWVLYWGGVHQILMEEAHNSRFSIHPEAKKMYMDPEKYNLRISIHPRDVEWYLERCLTCRKVKAEHQRPHHKMKLLEIPV
ncbi:hypothetical protein Lser_V15G33379 [Lactuca serriola]